MYTTSTKRRRPEDDDDQNSPSPYRHNKRPRNPASHFRPFSFPPRLPANAGMPPQTAIPPRQRSLYTQNTRTMRPLGVFYHPDPRARAPPDSHQDDIVVNSVEFDEGEKFTGVADYVHQLQEHETRQSPYITIRTEPDHNILPTDDLERDIPPSTTHLLPNVDYTRYPRIAHRNKATLIYSGSTYNPLIPLAIIRIAEKNMPFFNLLSAKNHIPNIHPSTPYPRIPPNPGFLDDIQWYSDRTFFSTLPPIRDSSDSSSPSANNTPPNPETSQGKSHPFPHPHTPLLIKVQYIHSYFADGRHCLGFHLSNAPGQKSVIFFTPCSTADIREFGLQKIDQRGRSSIAVNEGTWVSEREVLYEDDARKIRVWRNCFLKLEGWKRVVITTFEREEE